MAVNLEFLGNLLVLAAAILSVMGRATLSPGIVGLAVSHSLQVGISLRKSKSHTCYFQEVLKKNKISGNWDPELDCAGMD